MVDDEKEKEIRGQGAIIIVKREGILRFTLVL